jgi:hypothetical protein
MREIVCYREQWNFVKVIITTLNDFRKFLFLVSLNH